MRNDTHQDTESFRDRIATVSDKGKRNWIYPRKTTGPFHTKRSVTAALLLIFLFVAPWLRIENQAFILLNIFEAKFILFGIPFGPHDFYLILCSVITLFVFIVLFTALYGRIWCGWACPQTIFLEFVFRKIEYWIEGDASSQKALHQSPWTFEKYLKKISKQFIFFSISFLISNTFMAYLVGTDRLLEIVTSPPIEHLSGFIAVLSFAFIFYGIFSWFREQACIIVCPYGRLQSVLLDETSTVISYDNKRGEPRGHLKKENANSNKGDCIDCFKCVDVCPTGIDIRNGLQLECVQCTACIDVCNDVMKKTKQPQDLIRYASHNKINKIKKSRFTTRVIIYLTILLLLIPTLSYLYYTRPSFHINVSRLPGSLYRNIGDEIMNSYRFTCTNNTFTKQSFKIELAHHQNFRIETPIKQYVIPAASKLEGSFLIYSKKNNSQTKSDFLNILFHIPSKKAQSIPLKFIGPSS